MLERIQEVGGRGVGGAPEHNELSEEQKKQFNELRGFLEKYGYYGPVARMI